MARTVDLSVSVRTRQYVAATVVSYFLATTAFWYVARAVGARPDPLAFAVTFVCCVVLSVLLVRRFGADEGDDGGDSDVWSAVPRRQYAGRFAEAGGLTRDEQERALEDAGGDDR